jgi:hypothetical protein
MKKSVCILVLGFTALRFVNAVHPPAPAASPSPSPSPVAAPAGPAPALEVKNKSSFVMDDNSRNPFWPIGWKPAAKISKNTSESVGPEIQPTSFLVSSITVEQGARFAIINGKPMMEGQVFGLQMGTQTYQITVKSIQDGQVILLRRDQEIAVPLRRR